MALALSAHPEFRFTSWIVFFSVVAGLAATLFSVMFVTLQVRWRLWARSGLRRAVATSALGELMIPLFVSAITLMAGNPWRIAAWIGGLFGIAVILWHWRSYILEFDRAEPYDRWQAWGAWWSVGLYLTTFVTGFLSPTPGLYILASILVWLLFSGAGEAWILLTREERSRVPEARRFGRQFARWLKAVRTQADNAERVAASSKR
jgi:hypothetical protein